MTWNPSLMVDGDAADSDSINTPLDLASTWLNAIDSTGFGPGMVGPEHAASINHAHDPRTVSSYGVLIVYTQATFTSSIEYNAFNDDGGSATALDLGSGDRAILGHPSCPGYTGGPCILAGGAKVGMDAGDDVGFYLVLLNAELVAVDTNGNAVTNMDVMVCLQALINGTWYTLPTTERFVSVDDHKKVVTADAENMTYDIPIATRITPYLVDGLEGEDAHLTYAVIAVRAMVSLRDTIGSLASGVSMTFHQFNMSLLPIRAAEI